MLSFSKKNKILLKENEKKKFIEFKQKLFSHKRKKMSNLLKNYNFKRELFDLNKRVEEINLEDLLKLFREINF